MTVHLQTFRMKVRNYGTRRNRPILHRKELFVSPDYPALRKFARLTRIEEGTGKAAGLATRMAGTKYWWRKGLYFRGHRLLSARHQKAGS